MEELLQLPKHDDLVWFAGFFDGEGCVTLHRKLRKNKVPCYELMLQASSTHFPTLAKIKDIWSFGRLNQEALYDYRPTRSPCWHWIVYGRKALFLLEGIYPYLVTKRADAEIGISFQRWKSGEAKRFGKSRRPETSYEKEGQFKELLATSRSSDVDTTKELITDILGGRMN